MIVKILLGIIAALVLIILFGCVEPDTQIDDALFTLSTTQNELDLTQTELLKAKTTIIELQENNEYLKKQSELIKDKQKDLQKTYNKIAGDWQSCSMANYCLYSPSDCIDYVALNWEIYGYTAEELHVEYSDLCDASDRDWEEYWDAYTGEE